MNDIVSKSQIRKEVRELKRQFFLEHPLVSQIKLSNEILDKIEKCQEFQDAKVVLLYYSLPDELYTQDFVNQCAKTKTVLLPKVVGEDLTLHCFEDSSSMQMGEFNILEPVTPVFDDYEKIDLAIVPGVAFDRNGNRLGRGRGYYDKLFAKMSSVPVCKIGVCYPFQLLDNIPTEPTDVKMDFVVC